MQSSYSPLFYHKQGTIYKLQHFIFTNLNLFFQCIENNNQVKIQIYILLIFELNFSLKYIDQYSLQFKHINMEQDKKQQQANDIFLDSKLFNQALSSQTSHYIQSKLLSLPKDAQDLKKLDLRHMCETVVQQLQLVQKQAAYDYIQVSEQLQVLGNQLTITDNIMQELQNVLYNFKDHLESIKNEMTSLQQKSNKMNTSLNNRKKLQNILSSFIQSAILDKQLIDAICLSEINENYVVHIKALIKKLNYLNNNLISPDSKAVKQLQPELEKLKSRASIRLKQFLLQQINTLKKPKTNIQIVQKNILLKYSTFTQFFKDYYPQIFTQLCNSYRQIMAKVYLNNYKVYLQQIYKLQVQLYVKTDTLFSSDPLHFRSFLSQTKPTNLNQDKRTIFHLMNRDKIIGQNQQSDIILYNEANSKGQKFTAEQIFKSVNKVLMDGVLNEVVFTAQFFNVKSEGAIELFGPLFRPSLNIFLEHLKTTITQTNDIFSVLIIIALNERNKKFFNDKEFNALDLYFDQINILVWPKFEQLFDMHLKSLTMNINSKTFKGVEKAITLKVIVDRFADFMMGFYRLYVYFPNSKMIGVRIQNLKKGFFESIKKVCEDFEKQMESIQYYLNVLQIYHSNHANDSTIKLKQFYDDLTKIEKQIATNTDKVNIKYIGEFFPSVYELAKKNMTGQGQFILSGQVDKKQLNIIIDDLSIQNFSAKLQKLMNYCQKVYSGYTLKLLLRNFMNVFVNYYTQIYKYIKSNLPQSAAMMLQPHNLMKQIKTILTKYIN